MLLGLIAILVFVLHETHLSTKFATMLASKLKPVGETGPVLCPSEELNLLFEKVHLGISGTMGIYFLTCIYMVLCHWIIYKHWIRIDYEEFDHVLYDRLYHEHHSSPFFLRYFNFSRIWRLWRLNGTNRIHALRKACLHEYGLPSDFQFSKYFKFSMRDVVIMLLEVHPICWAILVVSLLFTLARTFIKLRVNNSFWTLFIYGCLSLVVSALSATIYLVMARVYRKVLVMPSINRHLHKPSSSSSFSNGSSHNAFYDNAKYEAEEDDHHYAASDEHTCKSLLHFSSKSPFSSSSSLWRDYSASVGGGGGGDSIQQGLHQQQPFSDSEEPNCGHTDHRKELHFKVFRSEHEMTTLMSVDEYRRYAKIVRRIFQRSCQPTEEDDAHKSLIFFRSKRFIVLSLQVVTFLQTWLFGLSMYYVYSAYADHPTAVPQHAWFAVPFVFVGPIITYGLMGPTLSKIVKATYTAGLIRPELIIETLFLPPSKYQNNRPFSSAPPGSHHHHRHHHMHTDDILAETGHDITETHPKAEAGSLQIQHRTAPSSSSFHGRSRPQSDQPASLRQLNPPITSPPSTSTNEEQVVQEPSSAASSFSNFESEGESDAESDLSTRLAKLPPVRTD